MAKINWATAAERLTEARDILQTLFDDNAPYDILIGSEQTDVNEVIQTLSNYADQLAAEIHFVNTRRADITTPSASKTADAPASNLFN